MSTHTRDTRERRGKSRAGRGAKLLFLEHSLLGDTPTDPPPPTPHQNAATITKTTTTTPNQSRQNKTNPTIDSPLKHVEEMLMTAIHTSRASLRRLVERQAAIEAEIASEQKQAARLEWLLSRVRSDYSFFTALDKLNQDE